MCFKKVRPLLYFAAFFLVFTDNTAAAESFLRPPSITKYTDERLIRSINYHNNLSINPYLLFEPGKDRGDITIDEKTVVIVMGGGDTAGLNDYLADMIEKLTARGYKVLGVRHGFKGLKSDRLEDNLVELTPEIAARIRGLPSFILGSCREKLKDKDLIKILKGMERAKSLVIIGGNDHLQSEEQIADKAKEQNINITVIGVPKSIDNDFEAIMFGFWSGVMAGREIAARASIDPTKKENENIAAVFEDMGRKSGSLTLEFSKACPYSHAVIIPEKLVKIDDIINAAKNGIRNFFTSEGFSLSESDPRLKDLLKAYPKLREMWDKAGKNQDVDIHGNPKLTGASLFIVGILEHFCGLDVERTDLTYKSRGTFLKSDNKGVIFEPFLADKVSDGTVSLIENKQSGFAVTYNRGYGDTTGTFEVKLAKDVYKSKDLSSMSGEYLASLGVLGIPGRKI